MFYPERQSGVKYNYAYFPLLIDEKAFGCNRDQIYETLKKQQIYTRRYFWPIVPDFDCYREQTKDLCIPIARQAGRQVLCLPIYNGLALSDVDRICDFLLACGG